MGSNSISFQMSLCNPKSGQVSNKQKILCLKVNGNNRFSSGKVDLLSQYHNLAVSSVAPSENLHSFDRVLKIPTTKQLVDPYRQGFIVDGVVYRQTFVIRSYEVGPNGTATIETILNFLQEASVNHVWMSGHLNGFGTTHGMVKNNLIWVISRMQVQVDHYPVWAEVIEIDTWLCASAGKNGIQREWLLRSQTTGLVLARATSTWVMMNQQTRRLSKIPDEVRAEISPWYSEKQTVIHEEIPEKIHKLDNKYACYVHSYLKPNRSDLDMNHHVNNVKYVKWMLETIPEEFLEKHQLCSIVLEYRKECGDSDMVQSLCEPHQDGLVKGISSFTHLLQINGKTRNQEIMRGKTTWNRNITANLS